MLQTADNRVFDVMDGQQHLPALSLLVLALLKKLQALVEAGIEVDNNRRRIEPLRQSFIGFLDPVGLVPQSKLTLNRHNGACYQTSLVPRAHLPQRDLKVSEHLLRQACEWCVEAVRRHQYGKQNGAEPARLMDSLADRLFCTAMTVAAKLNAYKVFETIDARGVRLSPTGLPKNSLFSVVHRSAGIEHVLPITPATGWEQFADEEIETLTYHFGNLTPTASATNRDLGNSSFTARREVCQASECALTRQLAAENAEWNAEGLAARQ